MNKPQTLKGFRDFLPVEKRKRDWVQAKIVETFETFGFEPMETPTLEYASLLLGKYGEEADKLVYTFEDKGQRQVGLRYDQTVPTARVLGQYQNDLPKYFRRYQIQNVFRADKPQKGRFREFTQCDIDIFGSSSGTILKDNSIIPSGTADSEIIACAYFAYVNIGFKNIKININSRETLIKIIKPYTLPDSSRKKPYLFQVISIIDDLDKIGTSGISEKLLDLGLYKNEIDNLLLDIKNAIIPTELTEIKNKAILLGVPNEVLVFDPTLARGLDYYNQMIMEVKLDNYPGGSLGGGGRYDNLIEQLTGLSMPAVGMAFGFDRTVEAADQMGLIPNMNSASQVLVTIFDESTISNSLQVAAQLRNAGIKTELYPAPDKLGKQFKLANQKNIPFVIVIGQEEIEKGFVNLKNMTTGEQSNLIIEDVTKKIFNF